MEKLVKERLDRLSGLLSQVSMQYKGQQRSTNHFVALTYTLNKKEFNKEKIQDVRKHIKKTTNIISSYRGATMTILSGLLASKYGDPKQKFNKIFKYGKRMKNAGFKNSIFLPLSSYVLLVTCEEEQSETRINKAIDIYKKLKKNRKWLTRREDYPLSIFLANSDNSVNNIIDNMEECYKLLNTNGFKKNNELKILSHILGFCKEDNEIKVSRCKTMLNSLKENKIKVYHGGYAAIGLLTVFGDEGYNALKQVIEVVKTIKSNKKYRWLTKETYLYTAVALVSDVYIQNIKNNKKFIKLKKQISIEALIEVQIITTLAAANVATSSARSASSY
ncbi:DUF4003 family protein [Clostridium psychrophilum]|uniref:DUF4003 family protein n=1 Tax=Clostridium psychrophilum TaxID=132926 RepID=UPI001C0E00F2|nr:DUF4003 family protein [Clostridium psychrophilum]MBU3180934.1 DUF4003 domain-containing protein [Clostridium psychrophilum]